MDVTPASPPAPAAGLSAGTPPERRTEHGRSLRSPRDSTTVEADAAELRNAGAELVRTDDVAEREANALEENPIELSAAVSELRREHAALIADLMAARRKILLQAECRAEAEAGMRRLDAAGAVQLSEALKERGARKFLRLVLALWRFRRRRTDIPSGKLSDNGFARVIEAWRLGGFSAVEAVLRKGRYGKATRARAYMALSKAHHPDNPWATLEAARRAFALDGRPRQAKWLAFRAFDGGDLATARERLEALPPDTALAGWEHRRRARILRLAEAQAGPKAAGPAAATPGSSASELLGIYRAGGAAAVVAAVPAADLRKAARTLVAVGHPEAELPLLMALAEREPSEGTLRTAFWVAQRAGDLPAAMEFLKGVRQRIGASPTPEQREMLARLERSPAHLAMIAHAIPERRPRAFEPVGGRLCYLLHNSLPYSSVGYATRSHGMALGLGQAGLEVVAMTRPGFPLSIHPDLKPEAIPPVEMVDGVSYHRLLGTTSRGRPLRQYLEKAADEIERALTAIRPEAVMAASNHQTGLPALIAARRLGLPFFYEMRGFWEVTRVSRDPDFADTLMYQVQVLLETAAANEADHVFTLTEPMREELRRRGVTRPVTLLPNSCDPARFAPRPPDRALAERLGLPPGVPVIGYIGTFVQYEGIEHLAAACARLAERGIDFRLLLVGDENPSGTGDGPVTQEVRRIAAESGLGPRLVMPGRVPHDEVGTYYSLVDIAAFPRKPQPVTELVSPIKPLEALAMEKAVVVSSVRPLAEMIADGETGLVFAKGEVEGLADALSRLAGDPALRHRLGRAGRAWVLRERSWASTARRVVEVVESLRQEAAGRPKP
jgi:glycosyltransferase involved in cell wall biosynthesis